MILQSGSQQTKYKQLTNPEHGDNYQLINIFLHFFSIEDSYLNYKKKVNRRLKVEVFKVYQG